MKHPRWSLSLVALAVIVGAAVSPTGALAAPTSSSAEGSVRGAAGPDVVAGSYLVTLRTSARGVSAAGLAMRYAATVTHRYTSALQGFAATMSERDARRLAADPAVASVSRDRVATARGAGVARVRGEQPNPPSWGLDRIDQRDLPLDQRYGYPNTASNVTAYVLDTGIRISHTDFGGRARYGRDTVDNDDTADDCNGHGTHIAGTVGGTAHGVAKQVNLVAVRVLNCQGSGTFAQVIAGIDWITANAVKPAVVNVSLGGGASDVLDTAIRNSIAAGITYSLVSGGSNADTCNNSPGRVTEGITAGGTIETDARASYSNYGPCLDIFAPASNITSTWFTSDTATNKLSGTSFATAHVTGGAALILADNPAFTPAQVSAAMVAKATSDKVTNPGTGSPNKLLYVGGDTGPPAPCIGENGTDVPIPDLGTATSSIPLVCDRLGQPYAAIEVHIKHTWRGDLRIELIAPSGRVFRLKTENSGDSADNVDETYRVNLSAENGTGTWRLRVRDMFRRDTGHLDRWKLTF